MFSLFQKKKSPQDGPTFHERATAFWEWFPPQAPRFAAALAGGAAKSLAEEVASKMAELLPGMAWEFGPGPDPATTSFTLSGEGDVLRQVLAAAWKERAPAVRGWVFHASRQPRAGLTVEFRGKRLDLGQMRVQVSLDDEEQLLDVVVWHEAFEGAGERERGTLVFLGLDAVLGELGTGQWIGGIEVAETASDTIALADLGRHVEAVKRRLGWEKPDPGDDRELYRLPETKARFPRADVVIGQTAIMSVLEEHVVSEGDMEDPVGPLGADLAYVSLDASALPRGDESAARGRVEDAIDAELRPARLGRVLGGAFGRERAYVDLVLLDGARSSDAVAVAVREAGLGGAPALEYFGKEKLARRVVI